MSAPLNPRQEQGLLLTLAGIQFAHILDFMIMMPLGPILIQAFGVSTHEFGLLVSAYTFTAAASGLLAASFVDRFERKALLLTLFSLFTLATLACGLAWGFWSLLLARCAAGAFGGILGAQVQTMVGDLIPFERRGRAMGTVMAAFSLSTVAGVPLSLFLANHFGWRAPFMLIVGLSVLLLLLGIRGLPRLFTHLAESSIPRHPLSNMLSILGNAQLRLSLVFSALIIFSSFMVIPYITLYLVNNVGIPASQIPLIYLAGGSANLFTSRLIGRYADSHGKVRVFRWVSLLALIPLLSQTHLPVVPLWTVLCVTTLFFIFVPGRMVPAMAIVTAAVEPQRRGTFMSLNGSVQQLASGTAAYLGGLLITQAADGSLLHYNLNGYVALLGTLITFWLVGRIHLPLATPLRP